MTGRVGTAAVHYPDDGGTRAGLVVAPDVSFAVTLEEQSVFVPFEAEYRPGEFFIRDVPAIRAVVASTAPLDLLVVDGYVQVDPDGRPGLGGRLHALLGIPVIGIAEEPYPSATHAMGVRRGTYPERPVFVTAAGLPLRDAAEAVLKMSGGFRAPEALRRARSIAIVHTLRYQPS